MNGTAQSSHSAFVLMAVLGILALFGDVIAC